MREFKAEVVEVDGKTQIRIKAHSEIIKHADGRQDVIIHAPSLELIGKQLNLGGN